MGGWQRRIDGQQVRMLCIQETHVTSQAEVDELTALWARMWGVVAEPDRPLSFWTITTTKAAGVGILLHPVLAGQYERVRDHHDDGRRLHIQSPNDAVLNVYAPNGHNEREVFFSGIAEATTRTTGRLLVLGDFNCVQVPERDRVTAGRWASGKTESATLDALVSNWRLEDAFLLNRTATSDLNDAAAMTFWQREHGARLDRGYVNPQARRWLVNTEVRPPVTSTDHHSVLFWFRDPDLTPIAHPLAPLAYPIRGRDEASIATEIEHAIAAVIRTAQQNGLGWDTTAAHLRDALRSVKLRERQRAHRAQKKWRRRLRQRLHTFNDVVQYEKMCTERRLQLRRAARLGAKAGASLLQRMASRPRQVITELELPMGSHHHVSLADTMATAWAPLLNARQATVDGAENDPFFHVPEHCRVSLSVNTALLAPITVEEIQQTIAATGANKAAGDDRLNNDFFRDWGAVLAPYLATEFNNLMDGSPTPVSFASAVIVPLPKNGSSPNPMDYRPIALLQSCYKIFTKLMAYRLQQALGGIINEDQRGFVRGRHMADNVRIMQALLEQEREFRTDDAEDSAAILLIDFRKAYDTLDRDFLFQCLRLFGFDERFVKLTTRLHEHTTARFLVNGDLSSVVSVNNGIRQGCPLAPLLFLIAVETLKFAIDQTPGLRGITLSGAGATFTHGWSAFVDDSVVFLDEGRMLPLLQATLTAFATVSGLHMQPAKSQLILLNARCTMETFAGFPVLPPGETTRYLGVQIGLGDLDTVNWSTRIHKIKKQLGIAAQYIASVLDRVTVLNAVALPSLLFTSKYFTPPTRVLAELDQLWRQYLWHGTVSSRPVRAHKIAHSILALPASDLGMGLHDIRTAMVVQASRSVLDWNAMATGKAWTAMHILLSVALDRNLDENLHTYPTASSRQPTPSRFTGSTTLLAAGWKVVLSQTSARYPLPEHLRERRRTCLSALPVAANCLQWLSSRVGQFKVPTTLSGQWRDVARRNYAAMAPEIRSFWSTFPWADNAWVVTADGTAARRTDHPRIGHRTLGETNLQYIGDDTFRFQNPWSTTKRPRKAHVEHVAQWIWMLIVNSGVHPEDTVSFNPCERVYSVSQHHTFAQYEWTTTGDGHIRGTAIAAKWHTSPRQPTAEHIMAVLPSWGQPVCFFAATGSDQTAQDSCVLQNKALGLVVLAGHPAINHGPVLVPPRGPCRRALSRHDLKHALRPSRSTTTATNQAAVTMVCNRLMRTRQEDPDVFGALQSTTPERFTAHAAELTIHQHLFRYRVVLGAMNLRDNTGQQLPCPHNFCSSAPQTAGMSHILWECVGARSVWHDLITRWTRRPIDTIAEYAYACFRPTAPILARDSRCALHAMEGEWRDQHAAIASTWTMLATVAAQLLWLTRNDACFNGKPIALKGLLAKVWTTFTGQASSYARRLTELNHHDVVGPQVHELVRQLTLAPDHTATRRPNSHEVRLYYDGGARGNPGCSGAGSVIVERHGTGQWRVVWWAATFCGRRQTNNYAEHVGLAVGLEECAKRYAEWEIMVTIVGDSELVTNQLTGRAKVTTRKLFRPVERAMAALTTIYTYQCLHTRRAGNKMADYLANVAMDTASSTTWTSATEATEHTTTTAIYSFLDGDIAAPTTAMQPTHQLEPSIRRRYELDIPVDVSQPSAPLAKRMKPNQ